MSAKYSVGQTVCRIQEKEPKEATVLIVQPFQNTYVYRIQYAEGATSGNDGTGFWTEQSLI